KVVLRSCTDASKNDAFRSPSPKCHTDPIEELFGAGDILFLGKVLSVSQRADSPGYNGDFDQWRGMFQEPTTDGVTGFVVRDNFLLSGRDQFIFLLQSTDYLIQGIVEIFHVHKFLIPPRCDQGSLVADVGYFRSRKPGGHFGQNL